MQVLVIDDSAADLMLMAAAFETCPNVDLILHDHAPTALRWVEDQVHSDSLPHLVLLDLHMPGMDGLAWLQAVQLQPALHQLPVLLYSLAALDLRHGQANLTTICGCWQKPLTFAEMQLQAEHLCRIWDREHIFTPTTLGVAPPAISVG